MRTVILAGGLGTRIGEETSTKPKPMVEIGNWPILCHIMNLYSQRGHNDFIVCIGYKGYVIKEYFYNYYLHNEDLTVNFESGVSNFKYKRPVNWRIIFAETGELTETGGRLKVIRPYIKDDNVFMMTYGDGVTDVDINEIIKFHKKQEKLVTFLVVRTPSRFGTVQVNNNGLVEYFGEKLADNNYINAGFFVLNTTIFDYIKDENTSWEYDCLPELVKDKQVSAYKYDGFWKCMDSIKDKEELNKMWNENKATWKIW